MVTINRVKIMGKISVGDGIKAGLGWTIGTAIGGAIITAVVTPAVAWVGGKLVQAYTKLKSNDTPQAEEVKE